MKPMQLLRFKMSVPLEPKDEKSWIRVVVRRLYHHRMRSTPIWSFEEAISKISTCTRMPHRNRRNRRCRQCPIHPSHQSRKTRNRCLRHPHLLRHLSRKQKRQDQAKEKSKTKQKALKRTKHLCRKKQTLFFRAMKKQLASPEAIPTTTRSNPTTTTTTTREPEGSLRDPGDLPPRLERVPVCYHEKNEE